MTKQIKRNLNFGEAKTQASKDKSTDKIFKINNPQYKDKPYLIEPQEYDDNLKYVLNIEKMKKKSKK